MSATDDTLQQILEEKQALADAFDRQEAVLRERLKELQCLRAIARLFDRRDSSIDTVLQSVVEIVPRAWQHVEVAAACLVLGDDCHTTPDFRLSPWCQSSPIMMQGAQAGSITVCYLEQRPDGDEGPFLTEERHLLDMIAQRLSGYIERRRTLESLIAYQEDLRRLASILSLSEQQERRRIAEGLHDRIGQNLALVNMYLTEAETRLQQAEHEIAGSASATPEAQIAAAVSPTTAGAADKIAGARALVSDIMAETRSLTFELCPPILYELGLGAALDWLGEEFEDTYGYRVLVREHGPAVSLSDDKKVTLFQAAREVLFNAARHGQATQVDVDLFNYPDQIGLVVTDNGRGFDVASLGDRREHDGGFGLFNIRERLRFMGGALEVSSTPGRGTVVRLTLPPAVATETTRSEAT